VLTRIAIALVSVALVSSAAAQKYTAPSTPVIGSANTVTADPAQPRPETKPCVVQLFSDYTFDDFSGHPFSYNATCPGPWEKVILSADFNITAGVQYDRTANIWIGGVNVYFGTTAEPSHNVARNWHVESDLTDYAPLFAMNQNGEVDLGNLVNSTYTGILYGSAELEFYPVPKRWHEQAPDTASHVYPLSAGPNGGTVALGNSSAMLSTTLTLPTNIERAYLDVIAQSQSGDEFWYTCVPNDVANELESCGGGAFREAQVTIDGTPAGVSPVYPWIYTGGIDPELWRPIPDISTLDFTPYRVDLTPFAGVLSNGVSHTVAVSVYGANNYFSTTATLLIYQDPNSSQITGEVTKNTIKPPNPNTVENITTDASGNITGSVSTTSSRHFEIDGYIHTSKGRVESSVRQQIDFSNVQTFDIESSGLYVQDIKQNTFINSWSGSFGRRANLSSTIQQQWPLHANITLDFSANPVPQTTILSQGLHKTEAELGEDGFYWSQLDNTDNAADTLFFDPNSGLITGNQAQSSSQSYSFRDSTGDCYNRSIASQSGALTSVHDGHGCWF